MKDPEMIKKARDQQARLFDKTTADIPADAVCKSQVRNRPYGTTLFSLAMMGGLLWLALGRSTPLVIVAIVCIVLFTVVLLVTPNYNVFDVYDNFIVAYYHDDPTRIRIIPNDQLIVWDVHNDSGAYVQFLQGDRDKPDDATNQTVITLSTVNYTHASSVLNHFYGERFVNQYKLTRYQNAHQSERRGIKNTVKYIGGLFTHVFNGRTSDDVATKVAVKTAAAPDAAVTPTAAAAPQQIPTPTDIKPAAVPTTIQLEAKPTAKPAAKTEAKPTAKTATKPAAKTEAKPTAKTAAKPAARTEAKPTAKPAAKTEAKPTAKTASRTVSKPAAKPAAKPARKAAKAK